MSLTLLFIVLQNLQIKNAIILAFWNANHIISKKTVQYTARLMTSLHVTVFDTSVVRMVIMDQLDATNALLQTRSIVTMKAMFTVNKTIMEQTVLITVNRPANIIVGHMEIKYAIQVKFQLRYS